ncbi:MAG: prepilin-type N-terminal cleavage/methylation domain-containing protein [Verrucomicrobia bacterium]|nr:prepilin-type N-terminal cleavage/methylation domain-containing protein [Verrucomicrobiota bacterium]
MCINNESEKTTARRREAFTLVEVVVALAISVMLFSGIIVAYTQTCRRAEWSGYSLAAQALAIQQLEQARAAKWDRSINELASLTNLTSWVWDGTNGSGYSVSVLDLPLAGTNNVVYATNRITVKMISVNNSTVPPVKVQMVRVDTVWRWVSDKTPKLFTNTVATYLAPDNLSADLL